MRGLPVALRFSRAGVNVVEDDRGDGLRLVGHRVDVGPPQHDRALPDCLREVDRGEPAVRIHAWGENSAPRLPDH